MVSASACAAVLAVMIVVQQPSATMVDKSPVEKAMVERSVDIDQVEGSIEDLDMLKQLGLVDDQPASPLPQPNVAM